MGELDDAAKVFLEAAPRALVARLRSCRGYRLSGAPGAPMEMVWNRRTADHVVELVRDEERAALHFEVFATPRAECPARALLYNVLVRVERGYRKVITCVIYLKPGKRRGPPRDRLEDRTDGPGGEGCELSFKFETICAWKEDARELLRAKDPSLLPLLPYARGATVSRVKQALARLRKSVRDPVRQADLMLTLATFAKDRFRGVAWFAMIPSEILMKSKLFEEVRKLAEKIGEERGERIGEERGKKIGEERGRREVLREQLESRLGSTARRFTGSLESATPSRLERLSKLLVSGLPDDELLERLSKLFPRRSSRARTSTATPRGTRRKNAR